MRFETTAIPGVVVVEPPVFRDERGWFMEAWHAEKFRAGGVEMDFVQENQSRSARGVLRGLHYQLVHPQGKLVRCLVGEVFDVAVDIRRSSPSFGEWVGVRLSAENRRQLWIPPGFAHGMLSLTEGAEIQYKCTETYHPEHDRALAWDDEEVGVEWPLDEVGEPTISEKDRTAPPLAEAEVYP